MQRHSDSFKIKNESMIDLLPERRRKEDKVRAGGEKRETKHEDSSLFTVDLRGKVVGKSSIQKKFSVKNKFILKKRAKHSKDSSKDYHTNHRHHPSYYDRNDDSLLSKDANSSSGQFSIRVELKKKQSYGDRKTIQVEESSLPWKAAAPIDYSIVAIDPAKQNQ